MVALEAAREAAAVVMGVYAAPFDVEFKAKDDPVTRADKESNALVCERLAAGFPGRPHRGRGERPGDVRGLRRGRGGLVRRPARRDARVRREERRVRGDDRPRREGARDGGRHRRAGVGAGVRRRRRRGRVGGRRRTARRAPIHVSTRDDARGRRFVVSRSRAPGARRALHRVARRAAAPCRTAARA